MIREDAIDRDLERLLATSASTDTTPDPTVLEASYVESVKIFHARVRAENRAAWVNYHLDQAGRHRRNLEDLITRHEAEAERLQTSDGRKGI